MPLGMIGPTGDSRIPAPPAPMPTAADEAAYRYLRRQKVKTGFGDDREVEVLGGPGRDLTEAERKAAIAALSPGDLAKPLEKKGTIKYRLGGGDLYNRNAKGLEDKSLGLAQGVEEFQPEGYKPAGRVDYAEIKKRLDLAAREEGRQIAMDEEDVANQRQISKEAMAFKQKMEQQKAEKALDLEMRQQDPEYQARLEAQRAEAKAKGLQVAGAEVDLAGKRRRDQIDSRLKAQADAMLSSGGQVSDRETYNMAANAALARGEVPPSFDEFMRGREDATRSRETAAREAAIKKISDLVSAGRGSEARMLAQSSGVPLPKGLVAPDSFTARPSVSRRMQELADAANRYGEGTNGEAGGQWIAQQVDALAKQAEAEGADPEEVKAALLNQLEGTVKQPGLMTGIYTWLGLEPSQQQVRRGIGLRVR